MELVQNLIGNFVCEKLNIRVVCPTFDETEFANGTVVCTSCIDGYYLNEY